MNNETHIIEYKREESDKILRSVVGFLNARTGGKIYVGVDDDGVVLGIDDIESVKKSLFYDPAVKG